MLEHGGRGPGRTSSGSSPASPIASPERAARHLSPSSESDSAVLERGLSGASAVSFSAADDMLPSINNFTNNDWDTSIMDGAATAFWAPPSHHPGHHHVTTVDSTDFSLDPHELPEPTMPSGNSEELQAADAGEFLMRQGWSANEVGVLEQSSGSEVNLKELHGLGTDGIAELRAQLGGHSSDGAAAGLGRPGSPEPWELPELPDEEQLLDMIMSGASADSFSATDDMQRENITTLSIAMSAKTILAAKRWAKRGQALAARSSNPEGQPALTPRQRKPMFVEAANPPVADELRRCVPAITTPRAPGYDRTRLTWDTLGPEGYACNAEGCYSYSGTNCCQTNGSLRPALQCKSCSQFFFLDELGDDLLTVGFLPHQRNYRFTCAWCSEACSGDFRETFQLEKPKIYEAIIDAFLNLMAEHKRLDYKVADVQRFLFAHWNTLMFGWPPLEAERNRSGVGQPRRSIAPEITKHSPRNRNHKGPPSLDFKDGEIKDTRRLYDQRPRQPMDALQLYASTTSPCPTTETTASSSWNLTAGSGSGSYPADDPDTVPVASAASATASARRSRSESIGLEPCSSRRHEDLPRGSPKAQRN